MKSLRCLFAALLFLAFGGGTAMAMAQGGDMGQAVVQVSVDRSMPNDRNKCGGEMGLAAASCSAIGICMPGIFAASQHVMPRVVSIAHPHSAGQISGLHGSPEPFPPRPDILA